jgi:hypothetical protein
MLQVKILPSYSDRLRRIEKAPSLDLPSPLSAPHHYPPTGGYSGLGGHLLPQSERWSLHCPLAELFLKAGRIGYNVWDRLH